MTMSRDFAVRHSCGEESPLCTDSSAAMQLLRAQGNSAAQLCLTAKSLDKVARVLLALKLNRNGKGHEVHHLKCLTL